MEKAWARISRYNIHTACCFLAANGVNEARCKHLGLDKRMVRVHLNLHTAVRRALILTTLESKIAFPEEYCKTGGTRYVGENALALQHFAFFTSTMQLIASLCLTQRLCLCILTVWQPKLLISLKGTILRVFLSVSQQVSGNKRASEPTSLEETEEGHGCGLNVL